MTVPGHPGDPEPVVGADRSGDALLDPAPPMAWIDVIVQATYQSWRLSGNLTAPIGIQLAKRRLRPVPGDLVMVPDSMRVEPDDRRKGFGYLVVIRDEPFYDAELWPKVAAQYEGRACPAEEVFYVQFGPALYDICRWQNATCMAIPTQAMADELWDR